MQLQVRRLGPLGAGGDRPGHGPHAETTKPILCNKPLVEYDYVGMGRVAITDYTGIDIQLDRTVTQGGDRTSGVYPGWDRWGRVRLHQWV